MYPGVSLWSLQNISELEFDDLHEDKRLSEAAWLCADLLLLDSRGGKQRERPAVCLDALVSDAARPGQPSNISLLPLHKLQSVG